MAQSTNAMRAVLDDAVRRQGPALDTLLEANSSRILTALVAAGGGWSVLTYSALANNVSAGRWRGVTLLQPSGMGSVLV